MKTVLSVLSLFSALTLATPSPSLAQVGASASPSDSGTLSPKSTLQPGSAADIARTMVESMQFRNGLAKAVAVGEKEPKAAFAELKKQKTPSGFQLDAETDYAWAVMDVGHQLLAMGSAAAAEAFFREADGALGKIIEKLSDKAARQKAGLLEHRAFIRANYLNQATEADADLEKAVALQPEDQRLNRKRDLLPAGKTGRKDKPAKIN